MILRDQRACKKVGKVTASAMDVRSADGRRSLGIIARNARKKSDGTRDGGKDSESGGERN